MTKKRKSLNGRMRVQLVIFFGLATLVLGYGVVISFMSLGKGVIAAGAWPTAQIEACSVDAACVLSTIASEAAPVWLGLLWLVVILAIVVFSFRLPRVPGTPKSIAAKLAAQRTEKDQRIGRAVGWVLVVTSVGFMLTLLFVPATAGLIPFVTWSKERRDACSADPSCVISTIPENALPVWIAFVWIAIIAAALVVCWKPARWWLPDAKARRHVKVRTFTSPFWIRAHALIAAAISFLCAPGIFKRGNDVYAVEYLWAVLAALTVAALATVCKRKYGMKTPLDVQVSLALTASAGYGVLDRRWRAAQRQLHPRGRKETADDN